MKPLSLDELENIEGHLDYLYKINEGPADYEYGPSEWDERLIHTARLAHKMREALEYYLHSGYSKSEICEKCASITVTCQDNKKAKQALALWEDDK